MAFSFFLKQLRWGDWMVLGVLLLVVGLTFTSWLAGRDTGNIATIHLPNGREQRVSLSKNADHRVQGVRGLSLLRVQDGAIRFVDSACPNKLCVQWGEIRRNGEIRVCLPNEVWVTIEASDEDSPVDAVTY